MIVRWWCLHGRSLVVLLQPCGGCFQRDFGTGRMVCFDVYVQSSLLGLVVECWPSRRCGWFCVCVCVASHCLLGLVWPQSHDYKSRSSVVGPVQGICHNEKVACAWADRKDYSTVFLPGLGDCTPGALDAPCPTPIPEPCFALILDRRPAHHQVQERLQTVK